MGLEIYTPKEPLTPGLLHTPHCGAFSLVPKESQNLLVPHTGF